MYNKSPGQRTEYAAFSALFDHGNLFLTENLRGTQLGSPVLTAYPTAVIVVSLNQYPMSILH